MTENHSAGISVNLFGEKYIDLINQQHFATRFANEIFRKSFYEQLNDDATFYVIIGTDSGLFPKAISNLPIKQNNKYLFVELDLIIPIIQEINQFPSKDGYALKTPSTWSETAEEWRIDHYIYNDKVKIIRSVAANDGAIEDYTELFESIKQELEQYRHEKISVTNQVHFLEQQLMNTVDNIYPVKLLDNTGKGTAIVLGAGPSLNDQLEWLKENQNKITVIAVSRIYQILKNNSIQPDIIVSSDPFDINYEQSMAFLSDAKVIFVHSNHVNYRLLAQWDGISLYRDKLFPWESDNNLENVSNEGPTVTHSALSLAIEMGFETIYLSGVDLCYRQDGTTHADGQATSFNLEKLPRVENYKGEISSTDDNLLLGIKHLSKIAKSGSGNIFNLSKNAAKVDGIQFSEVPPLRSPKQEIQTPCRLQSKQRQNHINMVKKEFLKTKTVYTEILRLCKEALRLNNHFHEKNGTRQDNINQIKLDKVEKKLSTKFKSHTSLAQLVASREFLRLLNQNSIERTAEQEHKWLDLYYKAYLKGAGVILEAIEKASITADARLMEYKLSPKREKLVDYWMKYRIPGRSCLFLNNQSRENLDEDDISTLEYHCRNFHHEIQVQKSSVKSRNSLAEKFCSNFETWINQRNTNEIKALRNAFTGLSINDRYVLPFLALLNGALEYLAGNPETAKQLYLGFPEKTEPEDEMNFMFFLEKRLFYTLYNRLAEIDVSAMLDTAKYLFEIKLTDRAASLDTELFRNALRHQTFDFTENVLKQKLIESSRKFFQDKDARSLQALNEKFIAIFPKKHLFIEIKTDIADMIKKLATES